MPDSPLLEWTAPEYEHRDRSNDWLWSVALGALLLALVFFYFGNFLFAVVIILSAVIVIMYARRPPQEINFSITSKGIRAGRELYPFSTIKNFSIPKEGDKFVIESSRAFLPRITIPLDEVPAGRVRDELRRHLKEIEHEDHLLDTLADRLGF